MAIVEPTRVTLRDGTEIVLRSGDEADAAALLAHVKGVLRDGAGMVRHVDELTMSVEQEAAWVAALRDHPGQLLLVAVHGGELIGNLDFEVPHRRLLAHSGTIGMSVHPAWRGRGVGGALMARFIDWAEDTPSIEKAELVVLADNAPAIGLYRRYGFIEQGRRPDAVKRGEGDYVDDILMYRPFGRLAT